MALATELSPRLDLGREPLATFDCSEVGLILRAEDGPLEYALTPVNSDTFASTGGDGVHFGFLVIEDRRPEDFPVVMTVPMSGMSNHVLGENLYEFLCLGCTYGYFALEQLAYDPGRAIMEVQSGEHACGGAVDPIKYEMLSEIRSRLSLKPWTNVRDRLRQLQRTWKPFIRLSAEGLEYAGEWDRPS